MRTLVIVGSGCSKGLAGLSTDDTFMRDHRETIKKTSFLCEALGLLYPNSPYISINSIIAWELERLEVCWNEIEENLRNPKVILRTEVINHWFQKISQLAEGEKEKEYKWYSWYLFEDEFPHSHYQYFFTFAEWELRRIVVNIFGLILNSDISKKYSRLISKINSLLQDSLPVDYISLNYDTLLEQALNVDSWYYDGLRGGSDGDECKTKLIKPHGSVSWLDDGDGTGIKHLDNPSKPIPDHLIGYKDNLLHKHSIIPMVGNKEMYSKHKSGFSGIEEQLHINYIYKERILDATRRVVREAEHVILIGYDLPITDGHIRGLFSACAGNQKKITIVNKKSSCEEKKLLLNRVSYVFKIDLSKIEVCWDGVEKWI